MARLRFAGFALLASAAAAPCLASERAAEDGASFVALTEFDASPARPQSLAAARTSAGAVGSSAAAEDSLLPDRFTLAIAERAATDRTGDSLVGAIANAVYEVQADGPVTFSVGGGVGYGRLESEMLGRWEHADGAVLYQGFGGIGLKVTERLELNVTGRYLGVTEAQHRAGPLTPEGGNQSVAGTIGFTFRP